MIRLAEMLRISFLAFAYSVAIMAQQGQPDPVFDRIPFEHWLEERGDAHIQWSMAVNPARLTVHQRLAVVLSVRIDGAEFAKRSGSGQMVVFLEVRDHDDRVFRTHHAVHFGDVQNPGGVASVNFDQYAFFEPGEYQVAAAVYDSASKEHALKKTRLRVPEVPRDPLPDSWRNMPEVEYMTFGQAPDAWYLPETSSRLNLPVSNERPVRVEVVVNESPTELTGRTSRAMRRNMGNLIPALKVLSQMTLNGSINVTLLDLERRKVSFTQEQAGNLDWTRLRAALLDNDPNSIDVHALENHEQNAQFFVSEVRKRLESPETVDARVLIVLSGPMAFPKGQNLKPIEASPEPGTKVFYICYYPPRPGLEFGASPELAQPGAMGRRSVSQARPPIVGPGRGAPLDDSLARTLKPLAPRQFNVTTPIEFRNALAAIMSEISRLK
jgi:hypothetical protein